MKIFESNIDVLRKSSPAKLSKRFVSCVIDMILVALLAEVIFMGAFHLTESTSAYKKAEKTVAEEIDYYAEFTEETHIVEYVDGSRVSSDVLVLKNLYRAICLSYEVFGNNQQADFKFDSNHDVMINGVHSVENDNVAYFYTRYLKENPDMSISVNSDLFEIYKNAFGDNATFMFSFNREQSELPVLNTQVAYYLFYYLFINDSDSIGQTGATYYQSYSQGYTNMLEEAEELIIQSEPYYSTHYQTYKEAYSAQARYTNITLILSVFVSCLAVLLVPRYLFKDEKTLGYKILGLGVIRVDGERNPWYITLIRTVINCVGYILIVFILYLFPPFNGGYEAMFMPTYPDSKMSLALAVLVIAIVGGVVNAVGLFTHNNQNLLNLIFGEVVVDIHYVDDGERNETNHGRSY